MPKGSEERTNARKEEIINACAQLYETMSFKEITIKEIGRVTSFTRTSVYNYFNTKEEIFLALLQREYDLWSDDLEEMLQSCEKMTADRFADCISLTLEKRGRMLRLLSMNHYDMESNSRIENLTEFKKSYGRSLQTVTRCLEKFFPRMSEKDVRQFLYAFFPFLFGVYPYTAVTEKQKQAMRQAGIDFPDLTIRGVTYDFVRKLLVEDE